MTRPVAIAGLENIPVPLDDVSKAQPIIDGFDTAGVTPLIEASDLAMRAGVHALWIKDERARMGLGSFKALGAAYVVAHDAVRGEAAGQTYVTASAGNHGISLAAGAARFDARAVVYIAETVPESFADRLRGYGAEVMRAGAIYEASMAAAEEAAARNGWKLLSDSSWSGYTEPPRRVMEGYLVLMAEAVAQMPKPPSHIFLQAGVGGLAAACAVEARRAWGAGPRIIVVEPDAAPALHGSVVAGAAVESEGPVSRMGRLDCKMPSLVALKGLARDADAFALISEEEAARGTDIVRDAGFASTPSGTAGVSALMALSEMQRADLSLGEGSAVLCILSECAES